MLHPTSGFRGTRAGVTAGSGPSLQADEDHGKSLPRVRVSFWCAKGHETQLVFLKLPDDQLPAIWDCRRCGATAAGDGMAADAVDDGYKSHLEYVKERRSSQDAEDLLAGALEKLRARSVLPD